MRYVGRIYRPPSEADALILQATIGCSWNHCTYCDMYSDKPTYSERPVVECLEDLQAAVDGHEIPVSRVEKLFVGDGDALGMSMEHWRPILERARALFPNLRRVSCYAMARNVAAKTDEELRELYEAGLTTLYIGPESGDDEVLKRIAKGDTHAAHVEAAQRAHAAGMKISVIALLGIASDRSQEHAEATARLVTEMDPEYFAALTVTIVPGTPLAKLSSRGKFEVPGVEDLLRELRTMIDLARPTDAVFRTNHASNYLPLAGRLPRDRKAIVATIDSALRGEVRLRPERRRGI
ncbi:MAG: radical SAM protein [Deltaproteobacteria bacterium]|nr:MAG: radical SAM protein [Deltaproteobacteria bacterium]